MAPERVVAWSTALPTTAKSQDCPVLPGTLAGAWDIARRLFLEDLTPEEQKNFENASQQSILDDMKAVERKYQPSMKRSNLLQKLLSLVAVIDRYGSALDVFSNACPIIMSPLWGGLRILLIVAKDCGTYFEKLLNMFSKISDLLSQFAIYDNLFRNHDRVVTAVSSAYLDVLRFFTQAKAVLRRGRGFYGKTVAFVRIITWRDFNRQFGNTVAIFDAYEASIRNEVQLAHIREVRDHHFDTIRADGQARAAREEEQKSRRVREEIDLLDSLHHCLYEFYKDMTPEAMSGTCDWFLKRPDFVSWQTEDTVKLLIVSLGPGCGKSVLARHLIDSHQSKSLLEYPKDSSPPKVCYFFFKETDENSRNAKDALRAMLHQLLVMSPNLRRPTLDLISTTQAVFTYDATVDLFDRVFALPETGTVIMILDALDECEIVFRSRFLKTLASFLAGPSALRKLKVIFTCRPQSNITDAFDNTSLHPEQIRIIGNSQSEQDEISGAIGSFIENKIGIFGELRTKRRGTSDAVDVYLRESLHRFENRTYLWISRIFFQLEQNAALPLRDLKKIIETLPETIEQTYEEVLMKCSNPDKARSLLHIVVAAIRPLSVHEINVLLSMHESDRRLRDVILIPELCLAKVLQELCGFFINVIDDRVYLLHPTAKYFLQQRPELPDIDHTSGGRAWKHSLPVQVSHEALAQTCLQYLQFAEFQNTPLHVEDGFLYHDNVVDRHAWHVTDFPDAVDKVESYVKEHPFLEYASSNWLEHIETSKGSRNEPRVLSAALEICQISTKIWRTWFTVYISRQRRFSWCPEFPSTLSFISWLGFEAGVKKILRQGSFTADQKALGLALASIRGKRDITKIFFDDAFPMRTKTRTLEQRKSDIKLAIKDVDIAFH